MDRFQTFYPLISNLSHDINNKAATMNLVLEEAEIDDFSRKAIEDIIQSLQLKAEYYNVTVKYLSNSSSYKDKTRAFDLINSYSSMYANKEIKLSLQGISKETELHNLIIIVSFLDYFYNLLVKETKILVKVENMLELQVFNIENYLLRLDTKINKDFIERESKQIDTPKTSSHIFLKDVLSRNNLSVNKEIFKELSSISLRIF